MFACLCFYVTYILLCHASYFVSYFRLPARCFWEAARAPSGCLLFQQTRRPSAPPMHFRLDPLKHSLDIHGNFLDSHCSLCCSEKPHIREKGPLSLRTVSLRSVPRRRIAESQEHAHTTAINTARLLAFPHQGCKCSVRTPSRQPLVSSDLGCCQGDERKYVLGGASLGSSLIAGQIETPSPRMTSHGGFLFCKMPVHIHCLIVCFH